MYKKYLFLKNCFVKKLPVQILLDLEKMVSETQN